MTQEKTPSRRDQILQALALMLEEDSGKRITIAALARQAEQRTTSGPSAVEGGEWAVQVGSFGEAGNAQRLMQKLRDLGYPAYSRERNNSLTTVYVGPFGASEDAEGVMSELKSRENLQGLLVKVDS
mgnify:CR=1 FL=1